MSARAETSATDLARMAWPLSGAADALVALAHELALPIEVAEDQGAPPLQSLFDPTALDRWVDAASRAIGLETEPLWIPYGKLEAEIERAVPAFIKVRVEGMVSILAVVRVKRDIATIVSPKGSTHRVSLRQIATWVRRGHMPHEEARVEALLDRAGVPEKRRGEARHAILVEQVGRENLYVGWRVGLPPNRPLSLQMRQARLGRQLGIVVGAQLALQGLSVGAWALVGKGALEGRLERGWLFAWGLLLATAIPFRVLASWWQGNAALTFAILLKRRLLFGALRLNPDETRREGAGQLLGRVLESEALEGLAATGALGSILAIVELLVSAVVLAGGPAGGPSVVLLAAWTAAMLGAWVVHLRRLRGWTATRIQMTHDLVERMVGHRTRLAQQPRATWHEAEDQQLGEYVLSSSEVDRTGAAIASFFPRGWLAVGLLALGPALVSGRASTGALAVGVAGVMLAYRALAQVSGGAQALLGAQLAWSQAAPLFRAGTRVEPVGRAALVVGPRAAPHSRGKPGSTAPPGARDETGAPSALLLEAREVGFRFDPRRRPVLSGISVSVARGDRVLIEGPSGGGKSTLAALLSGLRTPDTGLLLLGGLDRHALGVHTWRQRVANAPQFHDNHVLSSSFAFNLLMGRRWPALQEDLDAAESVCRELGLGELIDRMPAGLMQMLGETGWQLSHGERSRLFIARTLLQEAELVVLDESFAALDPKTLEQCLRTVLARANTVLVVAHP